MSNPEIDLISRRHILGALQCEITSRLFDYPEIPIKREALQEVCENFMHRISADPAAKPSVGDIGLVESYTVKDVKRGNKRGVLIGGLDEDGLQITEVFIRNRRKANQRGREIVNMMIVPFMFTPVMPATYIQLTVEAKRV